MEIFIKIRIDIIHLSNIFILFYVILMQFIKKRQMEREKENEKKNYYFSS
jgi:hypothetical protein